MVKKLLSLPLLFFLALALGIGWFYINAEPPSTNTDFKSFLIDKGSSASQIGGKLESSGLIKSALAFKIYLQVTGKAGSIQTGEFRLSPGYTLFQTVDTLTQGPIEIWVTIPEGPFAEKLLETQVRDHPKKAASFYR